ncbi:MAG: hypothetical protein MRK00_00175 [Nitrosomonas sp.]|nr:hypothetical protein [Nitrosomonas sp.]
MGSQGDVRKNNCLVLMATQKFIIGCRQQRHTRCHCRELTATKIFLPNVFARDEEAAALYRRMGLNTRQIDSGDRRTQTALLHRIGKRQALCTNCTGPLALAFVGSTGRNRDCHD